MNSPLPMLIFVTCAVLHPKTYPDSSRSVGWEVTARSNKGEPEVRPLLMERAAVMRFYPLSLFLLACATKPPVPAAPPEGALWTALPTTDRLEYRGLFPSGTALEPTAPPGLALTTANMLLNAAWQQLPETEGDAYQLSVRVDYDWVMLSLSCAPEEERRCTEAWLNLIHLDELPPNVTVASNPAAPQPMESGTRDERGWLEALLFEGHTYGRGTATYCTLCREDDVQEYYQRAFRSAWTRWGFGGALPQDSLSQLAAAITDQSWGPPPALNRFSPAPVQKVRLAILPSVNSERRLWAGQVNATRWSDAPRDLSTLPRRWAVHHESTPVAQGSLIETLTPYLKAQTTPAPAKPSGEDDPHVELGASMAESLPSLFPATILGPIEATAGPRTFILSTPHAQEDHLILSDAIQQHTLPDLDLWILEGSDEAPSTLDKAHPEPRTSSPSNTMPGASM